MLQATVQYPHPYWNYVLIRSDLSHLLVKWSPPFLLYVCRLALRNILEILTRACIVNLLLMYIMCILKDHRTDIAYMQVSTLCWLRVIYCFHRAFARPNSKSWRRLWVHKMPWCVNSFRQNNRADRLAIEAFQHMYQLWYVNKIFFLQCRPRKCHWTARVMWLRKWWHLRQFTTKTEI